MFRICPGSSDDAVNRRFAWGRGKAARRARLPTPSAPVPTGAPRNSTRAHAPPQPAFCHFVRTRGLHRALKQVAGVSILRRWRGGRAANCTGLENRRVFPTWVRIPPPPLPGKARPLRGCDSNPGWKLRCFASSLHLRRRYAAPRLRIPPPRSPSSPSAGLPVIRTQGGGCGLRPRLAFGAAVAAPWLRIPPPVVCWPRCRATCYSNSGGELTGLGRFAGRPGWGVTAPRRRSSRSRLRGRRWARGGRGVRYHPTRPP